MSLSRPQKQRRRIGYALLWLGDALWGLAQEDYSFRACAYCFLRARNIGEAECDAILDNRKDDYVSSTATSSAG